MELPEVRRDKLDSTYVDVYPSVWKNFKASGYVTQLAEDEPTLSVFNHRYQSTLKAIPFEILREGRNGKKNMWGGGP